MDTRSILVTTVYRVRAWSTIIRIAMGIWMPNEPTLSSPGWSSMPMVHMVRPMIIWNEDMWWIRTVSWLIFNLKNMNIDMDNGRASWTPMVNHKNIQHRDFRLVPHASTNPTWPCLTSQIRLRVIVFKVMRMVMMRIAIAIATTTTTTRTTASYA